MSGRDNVPGHGGRRYVGLLLQKPLARPPQQAVRADKEGTWQRSRQAAGVPPAPQTNGREEPSRIRRRTALLEEESQPDLAGMLHARGELCHYINNTLV